MRVGSIVETLANFEYSRRVLRLPYPKKGDVLTISEMLPHHNKECWDAGIVLLFFEETKLPFGLCDRTINGKDNFRELVLPEELLEVLKTEKA